MRELYERLAGEVGKVVVGQEEVVRAVVIGLGVGGHVLLEGPPGTAKTLLASAVSRALGLEFRRVQFTPDMLPSDLTGTSTLRAGELEFRPGPVFTNLLLADEINRTPPKTQAALLEAMQEGQVSADGESRPLPDPFLVVATQNPIEYEGTYPLPEAQLDRFLMKIDVGYPAAEGELRMLGLARQGLAAGVAGGRRGGGASRGPARGARDGRRGDGLAGGRPATSSPSYAARASCRACRSARARAPPSTCSSPRRLPQRSPAGRSSRPTTSRASPGPCSATVSCCDPRPSSSATTRPMPSARRSNRSRCRDERRLDPG